MVLGELECLVESFVTVLESAVLEGRVREQQVRLERIVGRLVDDLKGPLDRKSVV